MSFNSELEGLRKKKKECLAEARDIDVQKKAELDSVIKAIDEKYSRASKDKYQELGQYNDEIDAYCKKLEAYSYFNEMQIGNAVASLIRIFEGVNYVYQDAFYFTSQADIDSKSQATTSRKRPRIVVQEEFKSSTYLDSDNGLNSLVKNGRAIILVDDADTLEDGIPFYRANTEMHNLEQCVKFGKFAYVKEFIDTLIDYKVEHGVNYIDPEVLRKKEEDFIIARVDQIQENYNRVGQQQEEAMRKKLTADSEKRQATLQKVLVRRAKNK